MARPKSSTKPVIRIIVPVCPDCGSRHVRCYSTVKDALRYYRCECGAEFKAIVEYARQQKSGTDCIMPQRGIGPVVLHLQPRHRVDMSRSDTSSTHRRTVCISTPLIAPDSTRLMTHREAARRLGLNAKQLAAFVSAGRDPRPVLVNGVRFYRAADVQRAVNMRHIQASPTGKRGEACR